MDLNKIILGDVRKELKNLPDNSVDCCVTSPPYWGLRDYGHGDQLGLEKSPELYIEHMVNVFRDVKRVMKLSGTLWLNIGDSYAGGKTGRDDTDAAGRERLSKRGHVGYANKDINKHNPVKNIKTPAGLKQKDLVGIPWMLAFALRADGWYLRQDIIWSKPNPMPESVTDRCTKSHEYIFLFSKSKKYHYDYSAIMTECRTNENRPPGVERNRIYNYDSKENNNPEAFLKPASWNGSSFDKGKTGEMKHTNGHLRKSGNLDRKYGDAVGQPSDRGRNQGRSVPWEGNKANKRSVWEVTTKPFSDAHFATFPEDLIVDCIKAGCPELGIVLDPFMGAGTTALVARKLNRNFIGMELNPQYIKIANKRLKNELGFFL